MVFGTNRKIIWWNAKNAKNLIFAQKSIGRKHLQYWAVFRMLTNKPLAGDGRRRKTCFLPSPHITNVIREVLFFLRQKLKIDESLRENMFPQVMSLNLEHCHVRNTRSVKKWRKKITYFVMMGWVDSRSYHIRRSQVEEARWKVMMARHGSGPGSPFFLFLGLGATFHIVWLVLDQVLIFAFFWTTCSFVFIVFLDHMLLCFSFFLD